MRRLVATAAAGLVLLLPATAHAKWLASAGGPATIGSDTLSTATSFTSACVTGGVKLTWVKSPDTYVTSYRIMRSIGGGTATALVPDPAGTATTATDSFVYPKSTTYSYTISAKFLSWSSAKSAATVRTFSSSSTCS